MSPEQEDKEEVHIPVSLDVVGQFNSWDQDKKRRFGWNVGILLLGTCIIFLGFYYWMDIPEKVAEQASLHSQCVYLCDVDGYGLSEFGTLWYDDRADLLRAGWSDVSGDGPWQAYVCRCRSVLVDKMHNPIDKVLKMVEQ